MLPSLLHSVDIIANMLPVSSKTPKRGSITSDAAKLLLQHANFNRTWTVPKRRSQSKPAAMRYGVSQLLSRSSLGSGEVLRLPADRDGARDVGGWKSGHHLRVSTPKTTLLFL